MKKVYTVRGSQDGVIGVYTTEKRAIAAALEYVAGDRNASNVRMEYFSSGGAYRAHADGTSTEATLDSFYLNN